MLSLRHSLYDYVHSPHRFHLHHDYIFFIKQVFLFIYFQMFGKIKPYNYILSYSCVLYISARMTVYLIMDNFLNSFVVQPSQRHVASYLAWNKSPHLSPVITLSTTLSRTSPSCDYLLLSLTLAFSLTS